MGESYSRAKVSVALVGVGPTWELQYRNVIQRLSAKLRVQAVCDSVLVRAATVADELDAACAPSPWSLTRRADLHAWLILDPGWFDAYPAALAVRRRCPALLANTFSMSNPALVRILEQSLELSEPLMPEFPQRFTPATTRLRELMATKLGPARRIEVIVPAPGIPAQAPQPATVAAWLCENQADVIGMIDWCTWLIGDQSTGVRFCFTPQLATLELDFPSRAERQPGVTIRFEAGATAERRVECDRGVAVIQDPNRIVWRTGEAARAESFSHERSPYEIIVDQFCRRALGGLVPVPSARDALHALAMYQLALKSVTRNPSTP